MNSKFLVTVSALFVAAVLVFAMLQARTDGDRTDSLQPVGAVRVADLNPAPRTSIGETAAATTTAADIDELTARIQQLQDQLGDLMRSAPSSAGDASNASAWLPPESEQQERERTMQTTAFLHDTFVAERKDPVWSLQAERQVSDAFNMNEIAAGSQLQQLSCQATLCRIESRHKDENAERAFLSRLGRLESFGDAEAFSERFERPDGSIEAITYVSRSGHQLPRMEAADAFASR